MKINKKTLAPDLRTRLCALEILDDVLLKKQPFDTAFEKSLKGFPPFEGRDIGFVRELTMQALRRLGQIDDMLAKLADRPLKDITPGQAVQLLRIGAAQFLYMDVKDHAAVDTVVRLAHEMGLQKQKGFLNGVLRNFGRQKDELVAAQAGREGHLNTPDWLYKIWEQDYGAEQAAAIALAHLDPAPVDLTVKSDASKWAAAFGGDVLPNGSVRLQKSGRIPDLEGYAEGQWWVQAASAALPVQVMKAGEGMHIVDLCAAPGGKTMQIAATGAKVTAVDISRNRLERVKENLQRCGLSADIEASDGKVWKPKRPVDGILIDAPCTATGTIRHQPDVLHLKSRADMDKLIETQKAILKNAATFVRKGGEILYCTCSLQKAESEKVVENFLNENSNYKLFPYLKSDLEWMPEAISDEGYIRILPHHLREKGGMDGFFIARVIRT